MELMEIESILNACKAIVLPLNYNPFLIIIKVYTNIIYILIINY